MLDVNVVLDSRKSSLLALGDDNERAASELQARHLVIGRHVFQDGAYVDTVGLVRRSHKFPGNRTGEIGSRRDPHTSHLPLSALDVLGHVLEVIPITAY